MVMVLEQELGQALVLGQVPVLGQVLVQVLRIPQPPVRLTGPILDFPYQTGDMGRH